MDHKENFYITSILDVCSPDYYPLFYYILYETISSCIDREPEIRYLIDACNLKSGSFTGFMVNIFANHGLKLVIEKNNYGASCSITGVWGRTHRYGSFSEQFILKCIQELEYAHKEINDYYPEYILSADSYLYNPALPSINKPNIDRYKK